MDDRLYGNIQNSDYFSDAYSDYSYMQERFDNYYDKTEEALIATRKYAKFWNKNTDGILTDCLYIYELMKCNLEVKIANKRERFNVLNYAFEVKSNMIKYVLSHADKHINFDNLIDICMKETKVFRLQFAANQEEKKLQVVNKLGNNIYVANYIYEEILSFKDYVSTFVVQQKKLTEDISLHAVVNIREQFAVVIIHVDNTILLCDYSDYFSEQLDDKNRKYYFIEIVDKSFEFFSTYEHWRVPETDFSQSIYNLNKFFTVFESELQAHIPMPRQAVKTSVIKF